MDSGIKYDFKLMVMLFG